MTKSEQFYSGQNKVAAYDHESQELMLDAMEFDDINSKPFTLPEIVYLLRNTFKKPKTHREVLDEEEMDSDADPARGFCMISSYLIYSMTGGDKVWDIQGTSLHWWLYHKQTHMRFDITHTQFNPQQLRNQYSLGKNIKLQNTDPMFYDMLQKRAHILAQNAGLE